MTELGIQPKGVCWWRPTTTDGSHGHAASPDLVGPEFAAEQPKRKWLCNITYIPTEACFLFGLSEGPR